MQTRRTFIKQASLATTGLLFTPKILFPPSSLIGLQLFTVRDQIAKDPEETLAKIAQIGYTSVELFGYGNGKFFGQTPAQFFGLLKKYKLATPSGHYMMVNYLTKGDMDELKDNIAAAAAMGHRYFVIPFLLDNMRTSLDDYKRLADKFNVAATEARKAGMKLAYHNHNFEFKDWGGGKTGFDVFLHQTDPAQVFFEMDMYWVTRAGLSPIQLIKDHPGRFKMWHVKDMSVKADPSYTTGGQQYFAEVGTGVIDYKEIFRYKKESGMEYFYVEQDQVSRPVYDAISNSFSYVKANLAR
ncbi:sugar phosphate isomerase/epimerase family protein [Dinghuibacter silviterrae]|uniref:Sugar phosphate isomerase/epimerase n=1 Tax=Dinghuibacter silviterrae TaxID=1539049 RepID=A0A4R8DN21_9BACT|nr:sugar phosphate isomerase/epimerase [Dinghuibacter silviterrae]TDW99095.1 sugar phosphate isomerase/epimerase [Dinghuibacter silviterrae]